MNCQQEINASRNVKPTSIIRVDANDNSATCSDDAFKVRNSWSSISAAVSAVTHDLTKVLGLSKSAAIQRRRGNRTYVEVLDRNRSSPIELHDLIIRIPRTSTNHIACTTSLLESHCIFTDLLMPDIDECASSTAVNALGLVLSDNYVGQCCSVLKNEDGVSLACLGLSLTDIGGGSVPFCRQIRR